MCLKNGASRGPLLIDAATMKHWIRLYQHRRNCWNRLQQRTSYWNAGIPRVQKPARVFSR